MLNCYICVKSCTNIWQSDVELVSFAAARAGVTQRSPSPRVGTGSVA